MTPMTPIKPADKIDLRARPMSARSDTRDGIDAKLSASSELLFVVLPFMVIAITLGHLGRLETILSLPEWSIVSAVIVGQTIVKVVSAALGNDVKPRSERVVLVLSVLFVFLLVPTLVVLSIVLTSEKVSPSLAIAQAVLFLLSAGVFWGSSLVATFLQEA
jgi:hypothetical protein